MKRTLYFTLTILASAALAFTPNSIAQDNSPEYVVRAIYFYPNDLQPHPDIDTVLDYFMKDFQKHFADRMEFNGFGRKTFRFEADENGNAVVHKVKGNFNDAHYNGRTYSKVTGEFRSRFGNSKNIDFFVVDTRNQIGSLPSGEVGHPCGIGGGGSDSGIAVVPAYGDCFGVQSIGTEPGIHALIRAFGIHELLHAFGMLHDDSGPFPLDLTFCAAEWLDGHRYFNPGQDDVVNNNTDIQMFQPTLVSPPATILLRFEITDPDGLHQAQLIKSGDPIIACQKISGKSATVDFVTTELFDVNTINLQVMDANGNFTFGGKRFPIDIINLLPPAETISIPDSNLAAAVREKLGLAPGNPITQRDMLRLQKLDARGRKITNVIGLEHATHLRDLDLGGNPISDISPVSELTNLRILGIGATSISDISAVARLTNLTQLSLSSNSISDISAIAELTNIRSLVLYDNSISDISAVTGLTNLEFGALYRNNISDISPLVENSGLGSGDRVIMYGNPLSYASIYTHIPALQARGVEVFFDNRTPVRIRIVSGNDQQGLPGAVLGKPLVVEVQDQRDIVFEGVPVTFTVTAGDGTLSITSTTTNPNGRAGSPLTLGPNPGKNTVEVSVAEIREKQTFNAEGIGMPEALEIVSGGDQQGQPGTTLGAPFVVEVKDQANKPLANVDITFSVTSGGGTLSAGSVTTDANGRAESTLTLGPNPGTNIVTVSVKGSQEKLTFTAEGVRIPKKLEIISGDDQQGMPGTALEHPFVANVLDDENRPVPGVEVMFSVGSGGGTLSASSATTDSNGRAESTLTLGQNPGANTVTVSVTGIQERQTFNAESIRIPRAFWITSGSDQLGLTGEALANPFVVDVRDRSGEPMADVEVTFTVTGGGGTLSVTSAATDDKGRAESILKLGPKPGTNTVTIGVAGIRETQTVTAVAELRPIPEDVNGDDAVNILDLLAVAQAFGTDGLEGDVNEDGVVNVFDLVQVAGAIGGGGAAPSAWYRDLKIAPTRADVAQWLAQAQTLDLTDATWQRGVLFLEATFGGADTERDDAVAELPESVQSGDVDSVPPRRRRRCHTHHLRQQRRLGAAVGRGASAGGVLHESESRGVLGWP